MLQSIVNQVLHDARASWQKTAVLGLLLVVGLWFWIPPLWRLFAGTAPTRPAATAKATRAAPAGAAATIEPGGEEPVPAGVYRWEEADALFETDPLVRSVELAALRSDPFRLDRDQFSPPVLFAEEPPAPASTPPKGRRTADASHGLNLKSTIVGDSRRAALINARLYFEGTEIQAEGLTYRLTAIHPRKVVLRRADGETIELKLAGGGSHP